MKIKSSSKSTTYCCIRRTSNGVKVILLQKIDKLGDKNEIKDVKDGFARNFLIPKGLAKPATKKNLGLLEIKKDEETKKAEEELKSVQEKVEIIDGQEIIIPVKVGENDQLFESVTPQKISERLKELGFEIKKNQILVNEPIKELGEFPIKINFQHNLEAEIKLIITSEEESQS